MYILEYMYIPMLGKSLNEPCSCAGGGDQMIGWPMDRVFCKRPSKVKESWGPD